MRKIILIIGLSVLPFLFSECCKTVNSELTIYAFPNVLDVRGVPNNPDDLSLSCFSDLGAWHGYSLPDSTDSEFIGGFPGPFFIDKNEWLSPSLFKLVIFDKNRSEYIDFSQSKKFISTYYPGFLRQIINSENILVKLDLWFISSRSAIVRADIANTSSKVKNICISWKGVVFVNNAFFVKDSGGVRVFYKNDKSNVQLTLLDKKKFESVISDNKKSYLIKEIYPIRLLPGENYKSYLVQSGCFNKLELEAEKSIIKKIEPDNSFVENENRWNDYVNNVIVSNKKGWRSKREYQTAIVKCLETLITNWRSPEGDLLYSGLFPSYKGFRGFWAWDSWKHATALALFAPELAKDQIRAMFAYQDKTGMVPDVIYIDKSYNNWRNTKPPLAAWAVWYIYKKNKNKPFLKEMYPGLKKYHYWWYENRDHNKNGLCEYGSTDGTLVAAAWESGMDNAVRFDNAKMLKNGENSWSMNRESVDLNSYLYAEKRYLASIANVLGIEKDVKKFSKNADVLKSLIQRKMFDNETGYFYDILLDGKGFCKVQGPEGWIPLWSGVATKEQAEQVKNVITNPAKFATYIPFPTVAADHTEFVPTDDGYWRGPVWIDQAYFAIRGLENYGYKKEAEVFIRQLFNRLEGLKNSSKPICENYNPLNGKGLNEKHFSWSAALLMLLYQNE